MIICVEANIGAGKSTLLTLLKKHNFNNVSFIQEPVDDWIGLKDTNGKNILDYFYNDQNRWSFTFQMNSFISRAHSIEEHLAKKEIIIVERSVFTDKYCFAKNCYESGKMNKIEWDIYNRWHDWLVDKFNLTPDAYIYLKTNPNVCYQRILKRSRNEEDGIPLEYLSKLSEKHDEWLDNEKIPILSLDCNEDFNNIDKINKIIEKIDGFLVKNFNKKLM